MTCTRTYKLTSVKGNMKVQKLDVISLVACLCNPVLDAAGMPMQMWINLWTIWVGRQSKKGFSIRTGWHTLQWHKFRRSNPDHACIEKNIGKIFHWHLYCLAWYLCINLLSVYLRCLHCKLTQTSSILLSSLPSQNRSMKEYFPITSARDRICEALKLN